MDRESQKEEIRSAMRNISPDIRPDTRGSESPAQKVKVEIGGITVKNIIPREKSTGGPDNEEAAQRRCDYEPGSRLGRDLLILCLFALLLLFLSIATFSLNRVCVNDFDKLILVFGFLAFVAFVSSMASFAAVSVYKNS